MYDICQLINTGHTQRSLIGCPIALPWFSDLKPTVDFVLAMCAHLFRRSMHSMLKLLIFQHLQHYWGKCFYVVSTGIPGIVFGFLHLFYCIPCGLQGVPVASSYPVWSYVMIMNWYHHLLTVQHTFMLISAYFYWFCEMWHPPVKWLCLVQSILAMALMHAFITPWMILCHKWLRCSFLLL